MSIPRPFSDEQLFQTTLVTLLPYAAFCFLPGTRISYAIWSIVFLYTSLLYSYTFFMFVTSPDMPDMPAYTLDVLFKAFSTPTSILVIWVHTGAQDLVTMLAMFLLNRYKVGVPHFVMFFLIPMVWMVGPMAALIYGVIAAVCKLAGWLSKPKTFGEDCLELPYAMSVKKA